MPQPSNLSQIEDARAKQLAARRKMQSHPSRAPRPELSNVNWHDHYLKRVAK
jgi:hypothetical protein